MKNSPALPALTEHWPPRGTDRKEEIETGLLLKESQVCDEKWSIFTNQSRTFRTGVTTLLESMARTTEARGERESTVTACDSLFMATERGPRSGRTEDTA